MLLYAPEREEAERAVATGLSPGALLGGRHLLRLLVMLPALLPPRARPVERAFGGGGGGAIAGPESATVPVDVQLRHFMRWLARGADVYLRAPPEGERDDDDEEEKEGEEEEEGGREEEEGGREEKEKGKGKGKARSPSSSAAIAKAAEGDSPSPSASKKAKAKVGD